ncbi:hypothetical protein B484DRAFT_49141, partial [Ochromonadaceae sp. CCMP2298]
GGRGAEAEGKGGEGGEGQEGEGATQAHPGQAPPLRPGKDACRPLGGGDGGCEPVRGASQSLRGWPPVLRQRGAGPCGPEAAPQGRGPGGRQAGSHAGRGHSPTRHPRGLSAAPLCAAPVPPPGQRPSGGGGACCAHPGPVPGVAVSQRGTGGAQGSGGGAQGGQGGLREGGQGAGAVHGAGSVVCGPDQALPRGRHVRHQLRGRGQGEQGGGQPDPDREPEGGVWEGEQQEGGGRGGGVA